MLVPFSWKSRTESLSCTLDSVADTYGLWPPSHTLSSYWSWLQDFTRKWCSFFIFSIRSPRNSQVSESSWTWEIQAPTWGHRVSAASAPWSNGVVVRTEEVSPNELLTCPVLLVKSLHLTNHIHLRQLIRSSEPLFKIAITSQFYRLGNWASRNLSGFLQVTGPESATLKHQQNSRLIAFYYQPQWFWNCEM